MNRRTLISWLVAVALLVLALPPGTIRSAFASGTGPTQLTGAVPDVVANGVAAKVGQESATNTVNLAVTLRLRALSALEQLIHDLNDPSSPQYHHPLTLDQVNQMFNPTPAQQQQVVSWLQQHDLTVTSTYANHLVIDVQGTVSQVQSAFHVTLNQYQATVHGQNRTFYAPAQEPQIDSSLAGIVASVAGLDSYPRFWHPHLNGSADGQPPYYPQDFANAYDVNPLWNAGYNGSGQHIGITMWSVPPSSAALQSYGSATGVTPPTTANGRLKVIKVDGGTSAADNGEAGMDIEYSSGMAPGATIDYYEAPTDASGNPTNQGLLDALNQAGTDSNNNLQITNSWGGCEASSAGDAWTQSAESIFASNGATGHNYFFSSGDNGSFCDANVAGQYINPYPDYPASSPNVTSVGGTSFSSNVGSSWSGEVAWPYTPCSSSCQSAGGSPEASGGGYSKIFSRPSWQTGTGLASNGKRGYPDVSADADPNTGAYVCYGGGSCAWIGGTSLSSPLWAGMSAVVNQYLTAQGKAALGSLNPTLYKLATTTQTYAPFHDISSGSNGYYSAGSKWDAVTGNGTPDLWNIARDVAGASSGTSTATPTNTPTNTPTSTPTTTSGPSATNTPTPTSTPTNTPTKTPTKTPTPGLTNTPVPAPRTAQLVSNGGFETGRTPWQESSTGGYEIIDATRPHTGRYSGWLCGYNNCNDQIWETVTVPSSFTTATLSYWLYVDTQDAGTCTDTFSARVRTSTGGAIMSAPQVCNSNTGWVQKTLNVSAVLSGHKGQSVQVYFQGLTNSSATSDFFVDDVTLTTTG